MKKFCKAVLLLSAVTLMGTRSVCSGRCQDKSQSVEGDSEK